MASFNTYNNNRNNRRREEDAYWRAQDAARAREADQQRLVAQNQENMVAKREESAFPSLGGARSAVARRDGPPGPRPMGFATKAREWKKADEDAATAAERVKALEADALRAERMHNSVDGIFIWRPRAAEVVEEEESHRPFRENTDGWTEVSHHKQRAPRKALTAAQVDEMYTESAEEAGEFNGEHYENNKHDHR